MGEQNEVALHAVHADGNTSTLLNFENVKQESPEPGITLTTISLKDPLYPFHPASLHSGRKSVHQY